MKTTISFASAGLAIILAFPMTAQASDYGSAGQRVAHRQEQPVEEEVTPVSNTRPAFENQQRLLQEGQAELEMERSQDNRYHARDDRSYQYREYREYREYRDDRQEGRNRRRNQRRYRQYQYRGDWR
jgi:hypothetical protein